MPSFMQRCDIHSCSPLLRGMRLVYLPPYSPDLNPLEEGLSVIKEWMQSNREYVLNQTEGPEAEDPYSILYDVVEEALAPENARDWYRRSGYSVDP